MQRIEFTAKIPFIYDASHKGAPYTIDGGAHWLNAGELREVMVHAYYGEPIVKDANTAFDMGSDIPSMEMSVKSGKATLTTVNLGDTFETIYNEYFKRVHSTLFTWVTEIDNQFTMYIMSKDEFRTFVRVWSGLNERKQIRFKATSGKMITWLEARCA